MNSVPLRSLYFMVILPLVGLIFYGLAIITSGDSKFIFGILGILCFIVPLFTLCRLVFIIRKILKNKNISILPDLILFDMGTDQEEIEFDPEPDSKQDKKSKIH